MVSSVEIRFYRLGEFATAKQGYTFKPRFQGIENARWLYAKVSDMEKPGNERWIRTTTNCITDDVLKEMSATPFPSNTIIFPRVGAAVKTNKKRILFQDSLVDDNIMTVSVINHQLCDPHYLYYWFESIDLSQFTNNGPLPSINAKNLLDTRVPLPPLLIQRKITHSLSAWDESIALTSQLIIAKQQRKRSLVHQLLTGQRRFAEFTSNNQNARKHRDTDLPQDWRVAKLGEISTFLDEKRKPIKESDRANIQGPYPYYGASGVIDYVNSYLFDDNLILLGEDGENIVSRNTRLAFQISGKTWVNNHAHVIKPHKNVDITYVTEYLESLSYERYNTGTAQPKLNKATCLNINILLPSLPEQRRIAEILQACDREIELLEQKRDLLKQQKQGLMQQLLTGRVRVAVDPVEA